MNLFNRIRGRPAQSTTQEVLERAPEGVAWRYVRPRPRAKPVRARKARRNGTLQTPRGPQRYKRGEHYLIRYGKDDWAIARASIFERTYKHLGFGRYRKRTDLVLRCFTLERPTLVRTLEGVEPAEAGDWILEGVEGELWPVSSKYAHEVYEEVSADGRG